MLSTSTPPSPHGRVYIREFQAANARSGASIDGVIFSGFGTAVISAVANVSDESDTRILQEIVKRLLVNKGADWTSPILSEYVGLFDDSAASFALVWDKRARRLVAHGAVFQSAANPAVGLVAHIRTVDGWNGLGLGTLVTETVTRWAFQRGAELVCLATDDKRHRLAQGERAAHRLYSKLGYTILGQRELADTVDWLLVISRDVFERSHGDRAAAGGGRPPPEPSPEIQQLQRELVAATQARFSQKLMHAGIQPVGDGDLAGLFLLLNVCPPDDFRLKLSPWGVHIGPELERSYVVNIRPAILDRDRLEDASLLLRDERGAIVAVCAARQIAAFSRNTIKVDFYCLPQFLVANRPRVLELVNATLARIADAAARPRPCRLVFSGIDEAKKGLFLELGFSSTGQGQPYFAPTGEAAFIAEDYERRND